MSDAVKIRLAQTNDVEGIFLLESSCFHVPWSKENILFAINDKDTVFLTAEINNVFAGYISAKNVYGEMYIGNLAVKQNFRSRGVGQALINELLNIALMKKCEFVTLEVRKDNIIARSLYEKCGFDNVGIRPGFYSNPTQDACIYTKYLIS